VVALHIEVVSLVEPVAESLERLIEEQVPEDGMPAAERKKQIASLEALLLECERSEEALVVAAQSRGMDVLRRPRADCRAILGVAVAEKKAAKSRAHELADEERAPLEMAG